MTDNNDRKIMMQLFAKNLRNIRTMTIYKYVATLTNRDVTDYVEYSLYKKVVEGKTE